MTDLHVERLRCEHLRDPRGVDREQPRLSWQVTAGRPGTSQSGYQVVVATSLELLADGVGDLWDSGRVSSHDCVLVPYAGAALGSRQQAFWAVRVWDDRGTRSPWSAPATWEMGLLSGADWHAGWITGPADRAEGAVTYLRTRLHLPARARRARAYVTALGLYELHCNGSRVGAARFTPGWTDYPRRLQYQVLDLTDLLVPGENAVGVALADGWYAGYVGFQGARGHYGTEPALLAQIEVDTEDGQVLHVTDGTWRAGPGPILTSDLLRGESQDLRHASSDWCRTETMLTSWTSARAVAGSATPRVCSPAPPVVVLAEQAAASVERVDHDTHLIDFGQNLVGWVRMRLDGPSGATVTVRHAEVLGTDGRLYLDNLRTATATDTYLLAGDGPRWVEPSFTFHGFRYAEVSGVPGRLDRDQVTAVVCGSDVEQIGEFECSDEAVNQLHSNIVWGARGNFLDVPTDCPQRDERMGWTGDAQVFAPTACYLFDMAGFFAKWLCDLTDGQSTDGSFPDVAPLVVLGPAGSAGWADAGVVVPSLLWDVYADKQLLTELYPAMRRWVDYVHRANPDLLWREARGYDNGDWLAAHADTDKGLLATAYFARSARLTAQAADLLDRAEEARELHDLADGIGDAFRSAYLRPDGRLTSSTQTAYALSLRFGLVPGELRAAAAQHLADDIEAHNTHLTTGFLGVGELLPALSDAGRTDLAYRLLLQDGYPSWLYAVKAGATTIWERWDGWTAEAGYGDPAMNSYNHYALGSVGAWLYRTVAGIGYAAPGGRSLRLAPSPGSGLDWAAASHLCPYGLVRSGWKRLPDGRMIIEVEIPVGATAAIHLPGGGLEERGSGSYSFTIDPETEGAGTGYPG